MLFVMLIQIAARDLFNIGVPWTDEVSRYNFIAEIFLGAALAQRKKEHITITVFTDLLNTKTKNILAIFADIFSILVCGILVAGAYKMAQVTKGIFASSFNMSFSYIYFIQVAGVFLLMLLLVRDLLVRFLPESWRAGSEELE